MPRDPELLDGRNAEIRRDFYRLLGKPHPVQFGGRKTTITLNASQCLHLLTTKYHLAQRTLEDIVYPPSNGGKALPPAGLGKAPAQPRKAV